MKTQREQNENFGFHLWLSLLGMALVFTVATCAKGAKAADCDYRLYVSLGGGKGAYGSGTAIGPRCIVTAAHVVDYKHVKNVTCTAPDGTQYVGDCVAVSPKGDVALIAVQSDLRVYAPLAASDPSKGAEITAVGYGHDGVLRQGTGLVSYYTTDRELKGTRSVQSGDSGGGLFNANGELCGVIVACDDSEKTAEYHAGKLSAEPVSKVQWLIQAYQGQCPNGQCPLTPPDPSGYTGPLVPVQPRQATPQQQQYALRAPQFYVYPAPAPAPQAVPTPVQPAQPPDFSPLESKLDKARSSIEKKLDDLAEKAKKLDDLSVVPSKLDEAKSQVKGLLDAQGSLSDKIKAVETNVQGAIDSKVSPALGKLGTDLAGAKAKLDAFNSTPEGAVIKGAVETGLPTFLQWILGVTGVAGGGGGIVLIVTALLKLLGVVGKAGTAPQDIAQQVAAEVRNLVTTAQQQPGTAHVANAIQTEVDKVATFAGKILAGWQAQAAAGANPTTTAGT